MKENLKPRVHNPVEGDGWLIHPRLRAFCRMSRGVVLRGEAKPKGEAVAKASPKRALKSLGADAKPGDLPLPWVKAG